MKKEATRNPSGDKSSKSRSLPALYPTALRRPTSERFLVAEIPLAKHGSALGRLVPIRYDKISKGLANSFQWVRRAAGFQQREGVKTESKRDEWGTSGRIPTSRVNWSRNLARKPVPGFPLNCAFYRLRAVFNSASMDRGVEFCWEGCVSCEHGVDPPVNVGRCFDVKVSVPTTPLELLRTSEQWQRDLEQLELQEPVLSGKTNWEVIREAHGLLKVVLTTLEATVNEVSNKYELSRTSGNPNGGAYYPEDSDDIDVYEALYKSFNEVSSIASERCFQALDLVADCTDECQDITEHAPALLRHAVLDLVYMYSRIKRAHGILVFEKRMTCHLMERSPEQEERVFEGVWKQIELVSGCVLSIQSQVLQAALTQQDGTETLHEEILNLESRYQQSWAWLNKVGKQVAMIFVDATGELSQHPKQLPALSDANCKQRIYSITLTLLLSLIAQLRCNITLESQRLSQTLRKYKKELMYFAKPCLELIHHLGIESAATTSEINESIGDVIEGQDDADSELAAPVDIGEELGSTGELPEVTNEHDEGQVSVDSTSATSEGPTHVAETSCSPSARRQTRISVFENRSSDAATESLDEALVPETTDSTASNTISSAQVVEPGSKEPDDSLERQLPAMPSTSLFDRVNINAMTMLRVLGEGSSGRVGLVMFDNNRVAVKESIFPDPVKARERLERESKVHQRINSHNNIVRFLGRAVQTDEAGEDHIIGIITEWCEFGDLSAAIDRAAWIQVLDRDRQDTLSMKNEIAYQLYKDWIKRLEVVAGIAAGMVYMHNHHIVHRDLTSANVLLDNIDQRGRIGVKICDFERGYYLKDFEPIQRTKAPANSAPWMGPEVLKHEKYGLKADVYSVGTILWELMYLEYPWTHLKERVGGGVGGGSTTVQYLLSKGRISLSISEADAPDDVPEFPDLVKLVKRARERDPDNRPTMAEFHKEIVEICTRMKERVSTERSQTRVVTLHNGAP